MAKLFANSSRVLRHLIWVYTVCQVPFYRSPDYNGLIFFRENKNWYFMQIVCKAEDSHEMQTLFSVKKIIKTSVAVVISTLRFKVPVAILDILKALSVIYHSPYFLAKLQKKTTKKQHFRMPSPAILNVVLTLKG